MKRFFLMLTLLASSSALLSSTALAQRDANFTLNVAGSALNPSGFSLSSTLLHAFALNDSNLKLNLRAGADFDLGGNYAVNLDALATLEQLDYNLYAGSTLGFLNGGVKPGAILGGSLFITDRFDLFVEGQYAFGRDFNARAGIAIRF